ncbi:MAG: hypothetical protein F6K19_41000 [Cyanothece sp. SIO1E1]|nr:hypothetical protein [Cyanothece sp. SIO1E1]
MKKDQKTITIEDFSIVELNVNEQKFIKGGEEEGGEGIVIEEDVVN